MPDREFSSHFRQRTLFGIAITVLALTSGVALFSSYSLLGLVSRASLTQQSLLNLEEFLSEMKDIETGARGYALTRDARFLEPYRSGSARASASLQRLERLAADEPELAKRLPPFRTFAEQRAIIARRTVALADQGADPAALTAAAVDGKQAMDELRRLVLAAHVGLQASYDLRRKRVEREATIAGVSLVAGVFAGLLLLVWLFRLRDREIGRRREAESELRALNTSLEQRVLKRTMDVEGARRLLHAVIDNVPDPVFLKDANDAFRYVVVNRAGAKLLGRDPVQVIGRVDDELFPNEEAVTARNEDVKVIGPPPSALISERSVTTAAGKRVLELRKVPFRMDSTGEEYVLGIVRDLTETKTLEDQVRQMQRLDAVGRLTGGVAHDFNNLLAVVLGSVEMIREQAQDGSETAELADEAMEAAKRGADLVRRLLAFARKMHLDPVAVDLNERLPSVVPLLQRALGGQVRVQIQAGENLWPARVDPTQADDALVNLAINARDAMTEGGTLTIETANVILDPDYAARHADVEPGEYVMMAVSDTGAGMPADVIARAFEPFFTTKPEGCGTGLGLSQVYGWVKQSGGHIKIYSELGHGSTIKLYLPRSAENSAKVEQLNVDEPHQTGSERILLVEDNPNVRSTVKRQLADLGYSAIEADNAEAALDEIRSGTEFDLLLTDIVMPGGMSGYDLAGEAEKLIPDLRVLFMSGYTELAAAEVKSFRRGPLLSKPYSKRDLGRAIRSALEVGGSPPRKPENSGEDQ